jgi:hypothetical protein
MLLDFPVYSTVRETLVEILLCPLNFTRMLLAVLLTRSSQLTSSLAVSSNGTARRTEGTYEGHCKKEPLGCVVLA